MSDPTELVITCSFATALGVFVISSCARWLLAMRQASPVLGESMDEATDLSTYLSSPYRPPGQSELPPALPSGKVPVWFYRAGDLAGVCFVFVVYAGLVVASLRGPHKELATMDPVVMLINIGFQFVMAGVVVLLMVRRVSLISWLGLRWRGWPWVVLIAPAAVVTIWLVFGGLQYCGYAKWMESLGVETVQDTVKLFQKSEDWLVIGLMAFAAVVAAPLCEEIIFRGFFYPVMKRFAGMWPAAFCAALVFAAAHGSLAALLPLFLFGCLLVFIYEKTGSLWATIAVHFCFNGATVVLQLLGRIYHIPIDAAQ